MTYEQLENCYNTALKQRDESEVKVKQLVELIENDLWPNDDKKSTLITVSLMRIGV